MLAFVPIDGHNIAGVLALEPAPEQADFIDTVEESLRKAAKRPSWKPYAIVNGAGKSIGFIVFGYGGGNECGRTEIVTLLIDKFEQNKGCGKEAVRLAVEFLAREGLTRRIHLDYDPGNEAAKHIYAQAGFLERGLDDYGEMLMEKDI
ncbi:MAG: Spermine/spermidine acetyltransferase [Firmicutes bacterium ADurb.Bin248]|nr:MAG: Spermine/spermidine acetyltransferase [Firmicutes bacterium ADurb.Bin248]HOG01229.1 GNAT family protein [Clostridia bacterium]HPK15787.1 GNAT family protein [Clostridia bacterium]